MHSEHITNSSNTDLMILPTLLTQTRATSFTSVICAMNGVVLSYVAL